MLKNMKKPPSWTWLVPVISQTLVGIYYIWKIIQLISG